MSNDRLQEAVLGRTVDAVRDVLAWGVLAVEDILMARRPPLHLLVASTGELLAVQVRRRRPHGR